MKKQKLKTKVEKGITLIALIITIVVLLILAVVSIGAIKDSKIITHAQDIKTTYTEAETTEKIQLAVSEAYLEGKGTIDELALEKALKTQLGEGVTVTGSSTKGYVITTSLGKQYSISSSGDISEYEEQLERIYYVVNGQWGDSYVNSEDKVPNEATITARFYKTNVEIQPVLPNEMGNLVTCEKGYKYRVIIDGKGEMPAIMDMGTGDCFAWATDLNWMFSYNGEKMVTNSLMFYIGNVEIKGVSNLSQCAFLNAVSLNELSLDNTVKTLGIRCLEGTVGLYTLNLNNVSRLEEYALSSSGIVTISLENVEHVNDAAFFDCKDLLNVKIGGNITEFGNNIFEQCTLLETIDLGNANVLRNMLFSGCTSLKKIIINAESLVSVENGVFEDIADNSVIYVRNESVKNALEGKYDASKTTVIIENN